jgi:hypothetical protein
MKALNSHAVMQSNNQFFLAFLEAALWSECDSEGEPLEDSFSFSDIDQNSADMIKQVCLEFIEKAGNDAILEHNYQRAGHDFYLTIAGHGVGFWDGDWPENGEILTEICENWINHISVTDDSETIYIDVSTIGKDNC